MIRRFYIFITICLPIVCLPYASFSMNASADTIPPVIISPAQNFELPCNTSEDIEEEITIWYNNFGGLIAQDDDSDTIIYSASPDLVTVINNFNISNGCGNEQNVRVEFYATDDCDNRSMASIATFSLVDNINPTIVEHASPMVVSCISSVADSLNLWINSIGGAIAEDDCANIDWLRFTYSDNHNNAGVGFIGLNVIPIPEDICNWRVDVSFIVVDVCGNQGVTTSYFEIIDDVNPFLSYLPQDTLVGCEALPLVNDVVGIDYCTSDPDVVYQEEIIREGDPLDCSFYNYMILRTWEVIDVCGNSMIHSQEVRIVDTIPPSFFLVDSVMIDCAEVDNPNASFLPTNVSDNCSEVTISIKDSITGSGCNYIINREYTFTDVCGNSNIARQHIIVSDINPPEIIVSPSDLIFNCESELVTSFEDWYESYGGGLATEVCGNLMSFAAVPGSYNINDESSFPGTSPGSLDSFDCGFSEAGFLFYEEVDFVFYDNCANAVVVTAAYGISDDLPPVISSCAEDITIEADSGMCSVIYTLPSIEVEDNCVESKSLIVRTAFETITSDDPGNENVIVNVVKLTFDDYNPLFLDVIGNGSLEINISSADINDINELFIVLSESNDTLGFTDRSSAQCGNASNIFELEKSLIENWISNGDITFFLIPINQGAGFDGINDICESSRVNAVLSFQTSNDMLLGRKIIVNDNLLQASSIIDNAISLDIGEHKIDYIISDCGGNQDTCSFEIKVVDNEAPSIICPPDTVFVLLGDSCSLNIELPANYIINDNCALNKVYDKRLPISDEGSFLNFNEINQSYAAQNVLLTYVDVFTIDHANKDATLEIMVAANISDDGQHIEIKGEDGSIIGVLNNQNVTPCEITRVNFTITKNQLNMWGVDGIVEISFIPTTENMNGGLGIPPCLAIESEGPDAVSLIRARLSYSDAQVGFEVSGATTIPNAGFEDLDTIIFNGSAGVNNINLFTTDIGGNESSCSFKVTIEDQSFPKAKCKNAVVFLDPSGIEDLILDPILINDGSIDNCGIESMTVSPSVFNCSQLGEEVGVTLVINDAAGNIDSCSSSIMLRTEVLQPSFEIGVCDNDTLKLLANVPPSSVEDVYTFIWTGPNFTSVLENPVITNASPDNNGTYQLEISGFNGCVSTGTVDVNVEQLSSPVITTSANEICIGDDLLLTASGQTGNVSYNWYEGTFPNGLLIETTEAPSLQITPSAGDHLYYLVVNKDGCDSNPSPSKLISVVNPPVASVIDEFITVCRDDVLVLGTEVTGSNLDYLWLGPGGYTSDKQYPDTIYNASPSNEGIYRLIISLGTCNSDTASLQVTLFEKPGIPEIIAGDVFCEGSSISLSVNNIPNADLYTWYKDGEETNTTTRNTLVINNASEELSGKWTVIVTEGQCNSDLSSEKEITIESELLISANNDGPGCTGDSIQLSTSFVPGANYSWSGPQDFTSSLQNPKILSVEGEYFVTVTTPSGCDGESSTILEVITPPEITALSTDALECMDGRTSISLFPSIFPQGDYQYTWSGPANFDSTVINPVIENASEDDNGTYTLIVSNGNCSSEERAIEIDITVIPNKPIISGDIEYCIDDTLKLMAIAENSGNSYIWATPQGQRFTDMPELVIPLLDLVDMGVYAVAIEKGNCRSPASDPVTVEIGSLPFEPSISSNEPICPGDTLKLFSTNFRDATYLWSGPNGFSSIEQNPIIEQASSENEGTYEVTISMGSCSESSSPIEVNLNESPPKPIGLEEVYTLCETSINDGIEICLDEATTQPGLTYFLYNNGNGELLNSGTSICLQLEDLTDLMLGSNFIYIISEGENCTSQPSDLIRIDIISAPIIDAEVESNPIYTCDDAAVKVTSVFGPPEVNVSWKVLDENLIISNSTGKEIEVSNLIKGENRLVLSYSTDACPEFSHDTILLVLDDAPQAGNDNYSLSTSTPIILDVFNNDFIPALAQINIVEEPQFGEVIIEPDGIRYIPIPSYIGNISFKYEICGIACEGLCAEATVSIAIGDAGDCVAPTIFTPNSDGINDAFIVPCLYSGNYPNSKLQVYNQWGSIVFNANNYDNSWEGTYNGKPLPVGTYYYILTIDDVSEKIIGFLILER